MSDTEGLMILGMYKPEHVTFIHIPRTSGCSICKGLGLKHSHKPWWERTRKQFNFTVLRNPWDHALSWYVSLTRKESFEEWCLADFPIGDKAQHKDPERRPWWEVCHPLDQLRRTGNMLDCYYLFEERDDWWPRLCDSDDVAMPHINNTIVDRELWPEHTRTTCVLVAQRQADLLAIAPYEPPDM